MSVVLPQPPRQQVRGRHDDGHEGESGRGTRPPAERGAETEREERQRRHEEARTGRGAAVRQEVARVGEREDDRDRRGDAGLEPSALAPEQPEPDRGHHEHRREQEQSAVADEHLLQPVESRYADPEEAVMLLLGEPVRDIAIREVEGRTERDGVIREQPCERREPAQDVPAESSRRANRDHHGDRDRNDRRRVLDEYGAAGEKSGAECAPNGRTSREQERRQPERARGDVSEHRRRERGRERSRAEGRPSRSARLAHDEPDAEEEEDAAGSESEPPDGEVALTVPFRPRLGHSELRARSRTRAARAIDIPGALSAYVRPP